MLNCAGPFARTARPMMEACIAVGAHYLDITAEFKFYALAEQWSQRAADAGVMLLPGVGWDVVPSDGLALYVAAKVDRPQSLRMALQVAGPVSRGSATSIAEILAVGQLARAQGEIVSRPDAAPAQFDFGDGAVDCFPLVDTINGYSYTPLSAVEAARRVLGGEHRPGFQTPAALFGVAFAVGIADTTITDLPPHIA